MMALIIGWFAPLVGEKFAKPAAFASLALIVLLILWGGKCAYDHNVIANHNAKVEASAAKADRKADNKAAEQKEKDLARQNQETDQLIRVQQNAKDEQSRRLAFHRCLSLQQRARANGLEPPRCV